MGTPESRAEVSARLIEIAEHAIVAEWICCEPVDPKHRLCTKGYAALEMVRALLVDDPRAYRPEAPLLDVVMELLGSGEPGT